MKPLITAAVLALFSTAAFAGVVPLRGKYCGSDVTVDANGAWSEEDAPFDKVAKSGPRWWIVTYKDESHAGITSRITLSRDQKTLTILDSDSPHSFKLHACR